MFELKETLSNNNNLFVNNYNCEKMDESLRQSSHKNIKKAIIAGEQHVTHLSDTIIPAKKQIIDFQCKCKI